MKSKQTFLLGHILQSFHHNLQQHIIIVAMTICDKNNTKEISLFYDLIICDVYF